MHVGIVGAGIIGVSTACFLAERGIAVTLIDPEAPGEGGASRANAAQIFPALIYPLASPAVLKDALRLLTDKSSPLFLPLAYSLQMTPWLIGFARASRKARFDDGVAALTALNRNAYPVFEALLQRAGEAEALKRTGAIQIYESEKTLQSGIRLWKAVPATHRGELKILEQSILHEMEPALGPTCHGGVFIENTGILSDPLLVVRRLFAYAERRGAAYKQGRARHGVSAAGSLDLHLESGDTCSFDKLVIAAGVWSTALLKGLGEPQLLEAERGYNITLPLDQPGINHALVFADRGVVATQLDGGLRFGGWVELGGSKLPPNEKLFARMAGLAEEVLPGFDWISGRHWMGHRPSLPDSLPVIGQSKKHPAIYYAFGHGHLGMTQGPVTGQAIAALITGESPELDLAPFDLR